MLESQKGIACALPRSAQYAFFRLVGSTDRVFADLRRIADPNIVVGLGLSLVKALELTVPGLKAAPDFSWQGLDIPQTPTALCLWVRGEDPGEVALRVRSIQKALAKTFELIEVVDAFLYKEGRDLTGFEDGTENPTGGAAELAAFVQEGCLRGSSFMVVQQWLHDMDRYEPLEQVKKNHIIGRDMITNDELKDAPLSAHVKRTEQESFDPPQFLLRRSMAWRSEQSMGLVFVAFGHSYDAFEAQMYRMTGRSDGIRDGLFSISRPVSNAYFWCPPVENNMLKLDGLES